MSLRTLFGLPFVLAFASGCGGASASQPAVVFPTRAEVASVPAKKPLAEAFGTTDVNVDDWSFDAAPEIDGAAYDDASPWGAILREHVASHKATASLSPALKCAALEIARFHLKNHAMPTESLRRFTVARCGSTTPSASPLVWSAKAPAAMTEEDLAAHAKDALGKAMDERLAAGRAIVGMGVARDDGHASVVVVFGEDDARLEPGSRAVDANRRVAIRGVARGEYTQLSALINQGPYGVAHCDPDPRARPPAFAFSCELAPGDAFAWVQVLGQKAKLHLASPLVDMIVREGDASAVKYVARHSGPPALVNNGAEFVKAALDRVNVVRRDAKLAPLALAKKQSVENARLAGTLIDSMVVRDDATADRAALGILAGWDVEGTIRSGNLLIAAVAPTRDAGVWVDFAIERPIGRYTLLEPTARQLAIGPAIPDGVPALGAAVTTYAMFESDDHTAETQRFVKRLAATRTAHGLSAPILVGAFDELKNESMYVLRKGKAPKDALDDILGAAAYRTGSAVRGYVIETNDVDRFEIPAELLAAGPLRIAVGVTHHRVEGAAWGQYVVFVVMVDESATTPMKQARGFSREGEKGKKSEF